MVETGLMAIWYDERRYFVGHLDADFFFASKVGL